MQSKQSDVLAALFVAAASVSARPADACTYRPIGTNVVTEQVPSAGPIVVEVHCTETDYCDDAEPHVLVSRDGEVVEGDQEILRGRSELHIVWRPSAPLDDGARYAVSVTGDHEDVRRDAMVRIDASLGPTPFDIDGLAIEAGSVGQGTGPEFCCGGGVACFPTCVTEYELLHARIAARLGTLEDAPFVFVRMHGKEADGTFLDSGYRRGVGEVVLLFAQPAERYCATLEVLDLVAGETAEQALCVSNRMASSVGDHVLATLSHERFTYDCFSPPVGGCGDGDCPTPDAVLGSWCEGRMLACQRGDGCDGLLEHCLAGTDIPDEVLARAEREARGENPDVDPGEGAPGDGDGDQDSDTHADAGEQDQDGATAQARPTATACAISGPGQDPVRWLPAILFSALGLRVRRRLTRAPNILERT